MALCPPKIAWQLSRPAAHCNPSRQVDQPSVALDDPAAPINGAQVITTGRAHPPSQWRASVIATCGASGQSGP